MPYSMHSNQETIKFKFDNLLLIKGALKLLGSYAPRYTVFLDMGTFML